MKRWEIQVLDIEPLAAGAVDEVCALIAAEQAAAQLTLPFLPADFNDPVTCRATLAGLLANKHVGVLARDRGRLVGVMCATTREPLAIIPAEGLAIDQELADPTVVLVALYSSIAPTLLAAGGIEHRATHVNLGPVGLGLYDLGFGRSSVYATQPSRPQRSSLDFEIRVGTHDDLETIIALSAVELSYRFTAPIYASPQPSTLEHVTAYHSRLLAEGSVHLIARDGRSDVGLLTLEFTSPAPRLCGMGQPYIGPTATHPNHRGKGVGRTLVDAALNWAHAHDFRNVSVDFESANPLSRPFWLGVGFKPAGYQVTRNIHPKYIAEQQL